MSWIELFKEKADLTANYYEHFKGILLAAFTTTYSRNIIIIGRRIIAAVTTINKIQEASKVRFSVL